MGSHQFHNETHGEDIKASIRKKYRSVAHFERQHGLPTKSVTDYLRGRASRRVAAAIWSVIAPDQQDELPPQQVDCDRRCVSKTNSPRIAGGILPRTVEGALGPDMASGDREASTGLKIDPAILLTIIAEQTRTIEAAQATIRLLLNQAGGTGSTGAGA